jgi:hypothetical protein
MAVNETPTIEINRIGAETLSVPIIGTAPLIMNNWSEKAKRQMLDAMQGRRAPKEPKDPDAEYEAAFYRMKDGRYGFPVLAFKAATVEASRFYGKAVTKVGLRQCLFFSGEYSPTAQKSLAAVTGEPRMREDVVRVGMSGTDLRYRPEFPEWTTTLTVTYVTSALTASSVLSLIEAGGMGTGVGEWRPEKDGDFGTYQIDPTREVEIVTLKEQRVPKDTPAPSRRRGASR